MYSDAVETDLPRPGLSAYVHLTPVKVEKYLKPKEKFTSPSRLPKFGRRKVARQPKHDTTASEDSQQALASYQVSTVQHVHETVPRIREETCSWSRKTALQSMSSKASEVYVPSAAVENPPDSLSFIPTASEETLQLMNVTAALSFNDTESLASDTDSPAGGQVPTIQPEMNSSDSLEEMESSYTVIVDAVSPRFYESLPIKLNELLSSSSSEPTPTKLGSISVPPLIERASFQEGSYPRLPSLSVSMGTPLPSSLPSGSVLYPAPATTHRSEPQLQSTPVTQTHQLAVGSEDVRIERARQIHQYNVLKQCLLLWHGRVSMKKDQCLLFRQKSLLRKALNGLAFNATVAKEIDKMAIWKHNRNRTKLYFDKWGATLSVIRRNRMAHFLSKWKHSYQTRAFLSDAHRRRNHSLVANSFHLWSRTLQLSLKATALRHLWSGRTAEKVVTLWRARTALNRSNLAGERVADLKHLLVLKKEVFLYWRQLAAMSQRAKEHHEATCLRAVLSCWRDRLTCVREQLNPAMDRAHGWRNVVLLRKGLKKWRLKFRLRLFQKGQDLILARASFAVWKRRVCSHSSEVETRVHLSEQNSLVQPFETLIDTSRDLARKGKLADLAYRKILIRRCMIAWRQYIYQSVLQEACDQMVTERNQWVLEKYFNHWFLVSHQRNSNATFQSILSRSSNSITLQKAFTAWRSLLRGKQNVLEGLEALHLLTVKRFFLKWRARLCCAERLHQLVGQRGRARLTDHFRQWRRSTALHRAGATAEEHNRHVVTRKTFSLWTAETVRKGHLRRLVNARISRVLQSCFLLWRRQCSKKKSQIAFCSSFTSRQDEQLRRSVLHKWKCKTLAVQRLRNFEVQRRRLLLHQCFIGWHRTTLSSLSFIRNSFLSRLKVSAAAAGPSILSSGSHFVPSPGNRNVEGSNKSSTGVQFVRSEDLDSSEPIEELDSIVNGSISVDSVKRNLFTSPLSSPQKSSHSSVGLGVRGEQDGSTSPQSHDFHLPHRLHTRSLLHAYTPDEGTGLFPLPSQLSSLREEGCSLSSPLLHLAQPSALPPPSSPCTVNPTHSSPIKYIISSHSESLTASQLRILEESPSPPQSVSLEVGLQTHSVLGDSTTHSNGKLTCVKSNQAQHSPSVYSFQGDVKGLSPIRPSQNDVIVEPSPSGPYRSDSLEDIPDSTSLANSSAAITTNDVSFLSVSFCDCVSEEVRQEVQLLDLEMTSLDISEGDALLSDSEDAVFIWTDEAADPCTTQPPVRSTEFPNVVNREEDNLSNQVKHSLSARSELVKTHSKDQALQTAGKQLELFSRSADVAVYVDANAHHLRPLSTAAVAALLQSDPARNATRAINLLRPHPCAKALYHWHRYTVWYRALRRAYKSVVRSRMRRVCRDCVRAWAAWQQSAQARRQQNLQLAVASSEQSCLALTLRHWRERFARAGERAGLLSQQADDFRRRSLLKEVFLCCCSLLEVRQTAQEVVRASSARSVTACFSLWRRSATSDASLVEKADLSCAKWSSLRAMAQWRERHHFVLTRQAESDQFCANQNSRILLSFFHFWREKCRRGCERSREKILAADRFGTLELTLRAFAQWKGLLSAHVAKRRQADSTADCALLKCAFGAWAKASACRNRMTVSAVHHSRVRVITTAFESWKRRFHSISSARSSCLQIAVRKSADSLKKEVLLEWRRAAVEKDASRTERLQLLKRKCLLPQMRRAFGAWKSKFMAQRLSTTSSQVMHRRQLAIFWQKWKEASTCHLLETQLAHEQVLMKSWRRWRISFVGQQTSRGFYRNHHRSVKMKAFLAWRLALQSESDTRRPSQDEGDEGLLRHGGQREQLLHIFRAWKWTAKLVSLQKVTRPISA